MKISPSLFEAYLKCPTKCWRRAQGEVGEDNAYATWVRTQTESYASESAKRLANNLAGPDGVATAPEFDGIKTAKWLLALEVAAEWQAESCSLESRLHAVERIPSEGRGRAAQFTPIRFIYRNKLTKDDKLLLAFDAFVLAQALGREIAVGKIIHGDDHATLKVKPSALAGEVRKRVEKITTLLSSPVAIRSADSRSADSLVRESEAGGDATRGLGGPRPAPTPPDLVLNRHCAECEFRDRCRKIALEKDDLSLLAGMSAKERQKLRSKGIFTVTQLSYTFRPRRRPRRQRDKREKYHHSLKALAIREQKIHIVGSPELKIEGTPVYLDVEGLPDRDFFYLIGLCIGSGDSAVQHSLWADTVADEGKIWREFLAILETVEKPVLIHYGSYETTFLNRMRKLYAQPPEGSCVARIFQSAVNLLSHIFAQIYFPTFSNGLKAIANYFGFQWEGSIQSGLQSIQWRHEWEEAREAVMKNQVIWYNTHDCRALALVGRIAMKCCTAQPGPLLAKDSIGVVSVDGLKSFSTLWPKFSSPITEFEYINKAARWDYQRDRVFIRTNKRVRQISNLSKRDTRRRLRIRKVVVYQENPTCPTCGSIGQPQPNRTSRVLHDLMISASGIRARLVEYSVRYYWCATCKSHFGRPPQFWSGTKRASKYGINLVAFLLYQSIGLGIPQRVVSRGASRLFGFDIPPCLLPRFKTQAAKLYEGTRDMLLARLRGGPLVHVDETRANVEGMSGYVWVFTSLQEVAYLYSDSRESEIARTTLSGFKGVLVSDFFSAYDAFECPQQRCLLHLIRDLNKAILDRPFDEELKVMAAGFGKMLSLVIGTVDRRGLKKHFLQKHQKDVDCYFRDYIKIQYASESAATFKDRFLRNRDRLFTFLHHDEVPWNNNNAEHAIKAFAELRGVMRGSSTPDGMDAYLILLSVCQTCKYMGVDFLDFLRSGEKDIHAFAESRRRHRRQSPTREPKALPADAAAEK